MPITINIDYDIKYMDEKMVSFVITKYETIASAYTTQYFYNIDLETGRVFNLKDWYGIDYKQRVANSIDETISNWSEEKRKGLLISDSVIDIINENQKFYINNNK